MQGTRKISIMHSTNEGGKLNLEIIDNVNKTLKEDLTTEIHKGSKVSIAAACFSIYAFAELKKELKKCG